jgi:hypothetical protein
MEAAFDPLVAKTSDARTIGTAIAARLLTRALRRIARYLRESLWAGLAATANKPFALVKLLAALFLAVCLFAPARTDAAAGDGYDTDLAQAVRSATARYRLVVWAQQDGYVQSTQYIASFGTMYTNHARFDPKDLTTPTVLVYDEAGRLVACGYQFVDKSAIFAPLNAANLSGWYDIPKHVHYNIVVNGTDYYVQQPWDTDEQPTAAALIARKLMPADATLKFAFVHPSTRSIIIWAWMPNPDGLTENDNPSMP